MKNLVLLIFCCLILLLTAGLSSAQTRAVSPLRKFLQQDADTTIVFQYTTNWIGPSSHYAYFISKKEKAITLYTYRDYQKDTLGGSPGKLIQLGRRNEIMLVPENVNKFFQAYALDPGGAGDFWSALMQYKLWEIKDDKAEGEGCINNIRLEGNRVEDVNIYDGGGLKLSLITKDQVKILEFYAPHFYEEQCPGRTGRKSILKVAELFEKFIR